MDQYSKKKVFFFPLKYIPRVLTPNGLYPVGCVTVKLNKMVVTVIHISADQQGKQATFSSLPLSNTEPETHLEQPFVLQSHVMQSRRFSWQVPALQSLVKALSCWAACSGTVCTKRDLQTRWPKSESVGKYMFVFHKKRSVEVIDPHKSLQWNGLINQLRIFTFQCCQLSYFVARSDDFSDWLKLSKATKVATFSGLWEIVGIDNSTF